MTDKPKSEQTTTRPAATVSDRVGRSVPLSVGERSYRVWPLDSVDPGYDPARLPYSLKVLLENLLRRQDGTTVTAEQVDTLARWDGQPAPGLDVAFGPARVLMQDFTGVPAVVDLAGMRDAVAVLGGDPAVVNPLVPVELVIDHSVIAEVSDSFALNAALEADRNAERYALLRWAQAAFENFAVVPPRYGDLPSGQLGVPGPGSLRVGFG